MTNLLKQLADQENIGWVRVHYCPKGESFGMYRSGSSSGKVVSCWREMSLTEIDTFDMWISIAGIMYFQDYKGRTLTRKLWYRR